MHVYGCLMTMPSNSVFIVNYRFEGTLLVTFIAYSEIWCLYLTHPWGTAGSHSTAPGDQPFLCGVVLTVRETRAPGENPHEHKRTCKLHIEKVLPQPGSKPRTFLLRGDSANHYAPDWSLEGAWHMCFANVESFCVLPAATNVGMIVGATVGSVAGFIFLLLVCLIFLMRRRRDSEDDMANEIKWVQPLTVASNMFMDFLFL